MKKLLFIIAILLIPVFFIADQPFAWNPMTVGGKQTSGGACSTPDNGDVLDEGFVGAGYETTMADNQGAPDEDFTLLGSPPSDSCTEGLRALTSGSSVDAEWDNGSAIDSDTIDVDITCELYLDSAALDANFNSETLIHWDDDTTEWSTGPGMVQLRRSDPNYSLRGSGQDFSTEQVIAEDTWYTVKLHIDKDDSTGDACATTEESYMQITGGATTCDEVAECTFCRTDALDGRYFRIGASSAGTDVVDVHYGYCYVNTP
jgi:hypothetical protein